MELFKLFGTVALKGADEVKGDLKDVSDSAEGSETRMSGAFKKIGGAIATYFAAEKIIQFGKACVEAAASVAAETSAFEQIMGSYSDNAQAKINEVADATGIVSSRLTPYMTSLTAKFKGLGYGVDEATTMAKDGLTLAADASAFWDKSMEDSMSALNSFINGSYEGGEAIGLFANDTQMASYAVKEGIVKETKEWANLDEAKKQATRLEYAQKMMEASGATGQAAKESEQYANVVANLKENWRQFMAVLGTPLLAAVTPIIKGISTGLQFMGDKLKELPAWWWENVASSETFKTIMNALKTVVETLKTAWDIVFPHLQTVFNTVLNVLKMAWDSIGKPIFDTFASVVSKIVEVFQFVFPIVTTIFGEVVSTLSMLWETILKPVFSVIGTVVSTLGGVFKTVFSAILSVVKLAWQGIKLAWDVVLKPVFTVITTIIKALSKTFTTVFNAIKSVVTKVWNAIKTATSAVWNAIKSVVSTRINAIKGVISTVFNAIKGIVSTVWNGIKNTIGNVVNGIKSKVSSVWNGIKSTTSSVFNSIRSTASSVWNKVKSAITKPVEAAKNTVKGLIDKIKGFFKFDWSLPKLKLPHLSIKGGFSLVPPKVPKFSIKWYADGGIMTKPTMFGYDALTQTAHVGGEAGDEAIAPIDTLLGYVKTAVNEENKGLADRLERLIELLLQFLPEIISGMDKNIVLDTGALVGQLGSGIDKELGNIYRLKGRGR